MGASDNKANNTTLVEDFVQLASVRTQASRHKPPMPSELSTSLRGVIHMRQGRTNPAFLLHFYRIRLQKLAFFLPCSA